MCRQICGVFLLLICLLWAKELWAARSCAAYLTVAKNLVERLERRQIALRPRHLPRSWQRLAKMHPIFYGKRAFPEKLPSRLLVRQSLKELVAVLDWMAVYGVRTVPATRDLLARTSLALAALYWQQQGIEFTLINNIIRTHPTKMFAWAIDLNGHHPSTFANCLAHKIDQDYLGLHLIYAPAILLETSSDACYYSKQHQIFVPHNFVRNPSLKNGGIIHELRHVRNTINLVQRKPYAWYGSVLNTQNAAMQESKLYTNYRVYFTFDEVLIHYHDLRFEFRRLMSAVRRYRKGQLKHLRTVFLGILHDTLSLAVSAKAYLRMAIETVRMHPERVYFNQVGDRVTGVINLALIPDPSPAPDQVVRIVMPLVKATRVHPPETLRLLQEQLLRNLAANEKILERAKEINRFTPSLTEEKVEFNEQFLQRILALLPRIK